MSGETRAEQRERLAEIEARAKPFPGEESPNITAADAARGWLRGDTFYAGVDMRSVLAALLREHDAADASRADVPWLVDALRAALARIDEQAAELEAARSRIGALEAEIAFRRSTTAEIAKAWGAELEAARAVVEAARALRRLDPPHLHMFEPQSGECAECDADRALARFDALRGGGGPT